jgi:hypothetical protein
MKLSRLILAFCLIAIVTALVYAGKPVATHTVTNPNGFNTWAPNFRCDEKGNVIIYTIETGTNGLVSKITYEARAKNGKVYSQGELPGVAGVSNVTTAGGVSWANGGFDKGFLLLEVQRIPTEMEYIMYKLGKKGGEKIGSLTFPNDPMSWSGPLVYMYKKKIVAELYTPPPPTNFNGKATWEFKFYNYKLKQDTKKGGTTKAHNLYWNGKSGAFINYNSDMNPTQAEIRIIGP